MPNPQSPQVRRSERTATTEQPAPEATDPKKSRSPGHAHGTDRGNKGGGKGGGVPPDQQPPHPD
ncbi:hypothetical protein DZF91_01405 [Actinomadura logoneensis]|uniref:Uncharacterized protein n=1 Tax=Actinomadura logoneensis TaxID=2293572 RepID=A0A372JTL5_9ACTN|nr:hypothetical protein [Actinomadura logoneensis]RFU43375.1 hypothetical protein DZF91_01405 [Actinomadura logoneensis]